MVECHETIRSMVKSMNVSNITTKFHKTGIYPFNSKSLLYKVPYSEALSNCKPPEKVAFSSQLIEKHKRFENGNKIIYADKEYVQLLREFHPDSLSSGKFITAINFIECLDLLSGKEERRSAIDSEYEEDDINAKQSDNTAWYSHLRC